MSANAQTVFEVAYSAVNGKAAISGVLHTTNSTINGVMGSANAYLTSLKYTNIIIAGVRAIWPIDF